MLRYTPTLVLDKADPDAPPPGETKPPEQQSPAASTPPPKEDGDKLDEFGYAKTPPEKVAEEPPSKTGDPKKETPPQKPEEIKDPSTGYGKEPPKVEDAPPPTKEEPPALDDLDKALEGVPKEDAAEIKAFATENKVAPEVVKKWGEKLKANVEKQKVTLANMEKEAERQRMQVRAGWHKELKDDKDFGGEKFDLNISRAEKVLAEFMPQTKKALTEHKSMLPPYVMRDLAKMADHLYATDKLTQGDPIVPVKTEAEEDDTLAFYT